MSDETPTGPPQENNPCLPHFPRLTRPYNIFYGNSSSSTKLVSIKSHTRPRSSTLPANPTGKPNIPWRCFWSEFLTLLLRLSCMVSLSEQYSDQMTRLELQMDIWRNSLNVSVDWFDWVGCYHSDFCWRSFLLKSACPKWEGGREFAVTSIIFNSNSR